MGLLTPLGAFPQDSRRQACQGGTWVECCRMASSLSWILRSSSVPVLRQSARRKRREEARSRQRSRVSSAEARAGLVLFSHPLLPPTNIYGTSTECQAKHTHQEHICDLGPYVTGFRPERGKAWQNEEGEKERSEKAGALDNLS